MTFREIGQIVTAHHQREGGGFVVRRPLPTAGLKNLDPVLLLDELGPVDYGPGEAIGAPDHPHRGFETVTYILEGEGAHADSAGHAGTIGPGAVQWMTAGAGIVHREMPSERIKREGGRVHGFQLWVNLPAKDKMIPPRYQEVAASQIPVRTTEDGLAVVKIIAGSALGAEAVVATRSPITYLHWSLAPGASVELPLQVEANLAVYVFLGAASIAERELHSGQLGVLSAGEAVRLASDTGAELLILGGRPLNEPIAWMGPFVMNTNEELQEAVADFRAGRMGTIPAEILKA